MAVPNWPSGVPYESLKDGFSIKPFADPIQTEMEQSNVRQRARPGDNVAVVQQSILMSKSEYASLETWGKTTIGKWTGRFNVSVWLGAAYATKVCMFTGGAPKPTEYSPTDVVVTMQLRVFGV